MYLGYILKIVKSVKANYTIQNRVLKFNKNHLTTQAYDKTILF